VERPLSTSSASFICDTPKRSVNRSSGVGGSTCQCKFDDHL